MSSTSSAVRLRMLELPSARRFEGALSLPELFDLREVTRRDGQPDAIDPFLERVRRRDAVPLRFEDVGLRRIETERARPVDERDAAIDRGERVVIALHRE